MKKRAGSNRLWFNISSYNRIIIAVLVISLAYCAMLSVSSIFYWESMFDVRKTLGIPVTPLRQHGVGSLR